MMGSLVRVNLWFVALTLELKVYSGKLKVMVFPPEMI